MKRILTLLAAAIAITSCFGLEEDGFKTLEPIVFSDVPATIDVSLGETLVYDALTVTSSLPVDYQWAYGKKKDSGKSEYDMESMEVISTDPQIRYTFQKLGTYVLRLRADNGESIEYKYFTLNVNSGLDEGLLVLSNSDDGSSSLGFIKRRSASEEAEDAQEIWEDVFSTMNNGRKIDFGTSLFMSAFVSGGISYNHLLISTSDADGSIHDLDPKTMTLISTVSMMDGFGTWCCDFAGSQTSSGGAYTFLRGGNGHVYRLDLFSPFVTERTDCYSTAGSLESSRMLIYSTGSTGSLYTKGVFYNDRMLAQPGTTATTTVLRMPDGWRMVNFCPDRDANKTYVLLQSLSDPTQYSIKSTTGSLQAFKDVSEFSASSVTLDPGSKLCSSLNSNDVYFSHGNAIYRWGLVTRPSDIPAITLPEGEEICDIATNFMAGRTDGTEETLLYVATWNPSLPGEFKGSVYVYDIATDSLQKCYKGICRRPVKLLYKYRIS